MMKDPIQYGLFIALLALSMMAGGLFCAAGTAHANDLTEAGDILQIALPVTAFLSTYLYDDPEGRVQFSKAFLTSWTTVYGIKIIGNKVRPGDMDPQETGNLSFPSGHTMGAFAGASFLQTRYGWVWGLPAYFLAGLTGYSRIDAQAHYFDDVIAGASIAMLSNWYYATSHPKKFRLMPLIGEDAYGVALNLPMDGKALSRYGEEVDPRWSFSLFMGPSWPSKAEAAAPSSGGTSIDLTEFDADYVFNAFINVSRYLGNRHEFDFKLMPFEKRQNGVFSSDVSFAGETFPAGEAVRTRYRLNEWHLRYRYEFLPQDPISLKAGLGVGFLDAKVEVASLEDGRIASAEETNVLPLFHLEAGYRFNSRWRVSTDMLVCGCTASTFKAKSGTMDPEAPRAMVMTEKNVAISTIDGKDVFVTARNWWVPVVTKTKASVMPGEHTLVVTYAQTGWSSLGCRVTLDAQTGKTYVVKGKRLPFDNASGFAAVKQPHIATVVVWVEDADSGEKVVAETECEPVTS